MLGSTIAAANTAFLLQSTAFIGSPPSPAPGQQGGGVWVRGVDGNVNIKSTSTGSATGTGAAFNPAAAGSVTASMAIQCSQQVDVNFGGIQVGADLAKLNINGWNFHSGVTAGDLGAKSSLVGNYPTIPNLTVGFLSVGGGEFVGSTHVPFIGTYAAATNGGFAVDALLRTEYYQSALDAPIANVLNQNVDAHGWTFATSASYQWAVPDTNWFIEPSAGLLVSQTKVDSFNFLTAGAGSGDSFPGTLSIGTVHSDIGRVGLRFGETIESGGIIYQPFGAVSVWHEFGSNISANFASAPGFAVTGSTNPGNNGPATVTAGVSTSTFGTYEQYSLGVAAVVGTTGWSEFIRADYRDGPNLAGWSGSGGLRYQFTPGQTAAPMPMKAKAPPAVEAVNWTGFYVGGFGGAVQGTANWGYSGTTATGSVAPHVAGYLFGGDAGYNYQTGAYVVGVEADFGSTRTQGGTACGPMSGTGATTSGMYEMTCNAAVNWVATATVRLGYAWDRALFYVKGGGAWTNEQLSANCNYGAFNIPGASNCTNPSSKFTNGFIGSKDMGGWVLGWGTEYALTSHWSAKGEADYIGFGNRNIVANDPINGATPVTGGMHIWEEKIGVNYRF
jgi:opacity protein-like surface antigen